VGGINFHQLRWRRTTEAVLALSSALRGFTASDLACQVRALSGQTEGEFHIAQHPGEAVDRVQRREIALVTPPMT
jgi:hypothetical protein